MKPGRFTPLLDDVCARINGPILLSRDTIRMLNLPTLICQFTIERAGSARHVPWWIGYQQLAHKKPTFHLARRPIRT